MSNDPDLGDTIRITVSSWFGHCGGPDQRRAALGDGETAVTNLTP